MYCRSERKENLIIKEVEEENLILEYYLTQSPHPFKTGNINYICYGVEVRMKKRMEDDYCEIETVDNIFSSRDKAIDFLAKLANEKVTPCTLKDIVSDMLIEALG